MRKEIRLLFLNSIDSELENKVFCNIKVHSEPLIKTIKRQLILSKFKTDIPWVITSQKAAKIVSNIEPSKKIYAIGQQTASYFQQAYIPKKANALELAKLIVKNNEKEVLFICGNQRRNELPDYLSKLDVKVEEVIVYDTKYLEKTVNLSNYDALAFMSPSSVKAMHDSNGFGGLPSFAIGETTAQSLNKIGEKCIISSSPSIQSIIKAAQDFFN